MDYDGMDNDGLVGAWLVADKDLAAAKRRKDMAEYHLLQRMRTDGASVIDTPFATVEHKQTMAYDDTKLVGLKELVAQDTLESNGYTPEHEITTTVPAAWNMTRIKKLAKLGADHADIIKGAQFVKSERVKVNVKKG